VTHTITFKSDNQFIEILDSLVKEFGKTKSEVIRKSVIFYNQVLEEQKLKNDFASASQKVKAHSLSVSEDFDELLKDGLKNV